MHSQCQHYIELISQLHDPAALPAGERAPLLIGKKAGWTPHATAKKKNPCLYRESNPGRPAPTLVTILSEQPRLVRINYLAESGFLVIRPN